MKRKPVAASVVAAATALLSSAAIAQAPPGEPGAPAGPPPTETAAILAAQQARYRTRDAAPMTPSNRGQAIYRTVQIQDPELFDAMATLDAIPAKAPATPKKARKVLVYAKAKGWVHSAIPITAFTVEEIGKQTGAWTTTISYNEGDFTAENLAKYDVLVLDNTTGSFLDTPGDDAGTAARRKALMDFVRGGHGLVMTHAAGDSYHRAGQGLWPEYNHMVGGHFKFHWLSPQKITVKIDDPKSPLNAAFNGQSFSVHDETYTFSQDGDNTRKNLHVLYSIDYSKMDQADKDKEPAVGKRTDGDYILSWIRREGQGRVYYQALGHNEHIWSNEKLLQAFTAGVQYAAGDLAADDSPSAK